VYNFLQTSMGKAHFAYPTIQWQVKWYFHEIKLGDVGCIHGYEAHRVSGNRSKHFYFFFIWTKPYYMCKSCLAFANFA
jgi:hypothetical protein